MVVGSGTFDGAEEMSISGERRTQEGKMRPEASGAGVC